VSEEWVLALARLLGLSVEEVELTLNLDPRQKNQRIFQIIFELLEHRAKSIPMLLIFEDYHWADELSRDLVEFLAPRIKDIPVMLLLVTRPGVESQKMERLNNYQQLKLDELDDEDSYEFVNKKLNLAQDNRELEHLILNRAQGNPFFIEEIINSLIEQSCIVAAKDGKYKVAVDLNDISIPNSLQDVLLSRIDGLNEENQVVLKTASVIGRLFQYQVLEALCPDSLKAALSDAMGELERVDITPLEMDNPLSYIFKHILIRDVAYNTILISTREELHQRLAEHLESTSSHNLSEATDILAYHFLVGNDQEKGLKYTLMAARKAKEQYANENAIHHYQKALEILQGDAFKDRKKTIFDIKYELAEVYCQAGRYEESIKLYEECLSYPKDNFVKADVNKGLGKVYQEQGDTTRALELFETSLRLLGARLPGGKIATIFGIFLQIIIHLFFSIFPSLVRRLKGPKKKNYQKRSELMFFLEKIYFFVSIEKLTWAMVAHVNLAERLKDDADLSQTYSDWAIFMILVRFHKRSEKYFEKSLAFARKKNDPTLKGITYLRLGFSGLYLNRPSRSFKYIPRAVSNFKQIGEMWELQTALSIEATANSYISNFEECKKKYHEMGDISRELGSILHQAWELSFCSFSDYMLGNESPEEVREALEKAYQISYEIDDLSCQCFSLRFLNVIAVREGDVEAAARLAQQTLKTVKRYKVIMPHAQMAYIDAAEAAVFAIRHKAQAVPVEVLKKIARRCIRKGASYGKQLPYLRGPAMRVSALYAAHVNKMDRAESLFDQAIEFLEGQPNEWEKGVAYYDAAMTLPHLREQYLARAQEIFRQHKLQAELRRIERDLHRGGEAR